MSSHQLSRSIPSRLAWAATCFLSLVQLVPAVGQRPPATRELSLESTAKLTIPDAAPDGKWALTGFKGARLLRDGGFAVSTTTEIHRFDLHGRHVATLGRKGEGPGEFAYISGFAECPDGGYVVSDWMQRRLTVLLPPPARPTTSGFAQVGVTNAIVPLACDGGLGYFLDHTLNTDRPSTWPRRTIHQDTLVVLHGALSMTRRDTILRVPGVSSFDGLVQPFGAIGAVAINDRSIASGGTGDSVLQVSPRSGGPRQRVVIHGLQVVALTTQMYTKRVAQSEKETPPALWARELKELFAAVPRPTHLPLWDQLLLDDTARLWVREYRSPLVTETTPNRWHAVDATGAALGVLVLSPTDELLGVHGNEAIVVHHADDDTESLQVRRIRGL